MSTYNINIRGNLTTCKDIPYTKYFEFCSYENWSLHNYVSMIIDNYKFAEKNKTYQMFFNTLQSINNDLCVSEEIRNISQKLLANKKVGTTFKAEMILWAYSQVLGSCTYWIRSLCTFPYVNKNLTIGVFLHPPSNLVFV